MKSEDKNWNDEGQLIIKMEKKTPKLYILNMKYKGTCYECQIYTLAYI